MNTTDPVLRHTWRKFAAGIACLAVPLLLTSASLVAQQQPGGSGESGVRVGDRIILKVDGEAQLSDTFTVTAGPALSLPIVGSVSLAGIRRENIEKRLVNRR